LGLSGYDLLEFVRRLIQLRKEHPVFRRWESFSTAKASIVRMPAANGSSIKASMCCSMGDWGKEWIVVLDSNKPLPEEEEQRYKPGDEIPVESHSVKVRRRVN